MKRGRLLIPSLLGVAALLLVAGALVRWTGSRPVTASAQPGDGDPPESFRFRPGQSRAYLWSLRQLAGAGPGAPAPETVLEGRLNLRVLTTGAVTKIAIQLAPLEVRIAGQPSPAAARDLGRPFLVEMSPRGEVRAASFEPEVSQRHRPMLESMFRMLQIVLPGGRTARWETRETDLAGAFDAAYEQVGARGVAKRKLRYVEGASRLASTKVVSSRFQAELDPAGFWLDRLEGAEQAQVETPDGRVVGVVEGRITLQSTRDPVDGALAIWKVDELLTRGVPAGGGPGPVPARAALDEDRARAERERFRREGETLDHLVAGLATHKPQDAAFGHRFAAFVRAFPERAGALAARVRHVPEMQAALLVNVLELAGVPEAQAALLEIAEGAGESEQSRLQALAALAGVAAPTAETLARLQRLAATLTDEGAANAVASSALLTLGALASKAEGGLRDSSVRAIEAGLADAREPAVQRVHLLALENAGAKVPDGALAAYLASDDAGVRQAAVAGAVRSGDAASAGRIAAIVERDASPAVRLAAVEALSQLPPDSGVDSTVARRLSGGAEPDPHVRAQMVRLLASRMKEQPARRRDLEEALRRERDREVIVAIANALVP